MNTETEVLALRDEIARLRRVVHRPYDIDLVHAFPFYAFLYKDDLSYRGFSEEMKNQAHTTMPIARHVDEPIDVDMWLTTWKPADGVIERTIAHYARTFPSFVVIDIGCQYGFSAMLAARFMRRARIDAVVHAFDCGVAGELAPINIEHNGYSDKVQFWPLAVSALDGWSLMYSEPGNSENNRVVNWLGANTLAKPVRSIRLDTFMEKQEIGRLPAIIKIDTQGAEPEVLAGAVETIARKPVAMIVEFTPFAIRNRVNPTEFVRGLDRTHVLFDVGHYHHAVTPVDVTMAEEFVHIVDESDSKWTDLLALPRTLPGLERLIAALTA